MTVAIYRCFPGDRVVKNPPAKQRTQVQSLGQEDPLEKEMATHSSTLAQRIPWTEEPGRLHSTASQRLGYSIATEHKREPLKVMWSLHM